MKKTFSITLLSLMVLVALAGCQSGTDNTTPTPTPSPSSDTSTPTPAPSPSSDTSMSDTQSSSMSDTSTQSSSSSSSTSTAEVKTPSDAKNVNNVDMAGQKATTYDSAMAVNAACEAQAKMVADAGYKASSVTPSPAIANGNWAQTFEGSDMVVLTCTADPANKGMTLVSMAHTPKMDVMGN